MTKYLSSSFLIFYFLIFTSSITSNQIKTKSSQNSCSNAPAYSVTAWAGGSYVTYNGQCFRARTVGAAGHQTPWDSSTYNSISGWDLMTVPSTKPSNTPSSNPCSNFGNNCVDCSLKKCLECASGYLLTSKGDKCEANPCAGFGAQCVDCSKKKCVECADGYEVNGSGSCEASNPCSSFGKQCTDCSLKKCVECSNGFELSKDSQSCNEKPNKCAKMAAWDRGIATGQKAPWTYNGGDVVSYDGNYYIANWGGQEVPGSRKCDGVAACKNAGIQWVKQGSCF